MATPFAAFEGHTLSAIELRIPELGAWTANITMSDPPTGATFTTGTLTLAGLSLVGTVVRGGAWHGEYRALVVGGKGGWQKEIPAKGYQSAVTVKASLVLKDAARECGETIELTTDFGLGSNYIRERAPAGRVLGRLGRAWHIRADGVTVVAPRAAGVVGVAFDVIDGDTAQGRYVIATEAPEAFEPGKRISAPSLSAITIKSLVHRASGKEFRTEVWA